MIQGTFSGKSAKEILSILQKNTAPSLPSREAQAQARWLLEHFFAASWIDVITEKPLTITEEKEIELASALQKLKKGMPIHYVLGYAWFRGHRFEVGPDVLIPRPETEELINWVLEKMQGQKAQSLLDIGTGSGILAITAAMEKPSWEVYAMDISSSALAVARKNAQKHQAKVTFIQADILNVGNADQKLPPIDLIVSNPPYVLEKEKVQMENHVLEYEPPLALFVPNEDPLRFYKAIAAFALLQLSENGHLFLEINESQGQNTLKLLKDLGFSAVELKKDLHGKDRLVHATRKAMN